MFYCFSIYHNEIIFTKTAASFSKKTCSSVTRTKLELYFGPEINSARI
jgi:hypothetical protein